MAADDERTAKNVSGSVAKRNASDFVQDSLHTFLPLASGCH